jgi:pimeloyl-ACP methyl ester carboxylesterase
MPLVRDRRNIDSSVPDGGIMLAWTGQPDQRGGRSGAVFAARVREALRELGAPSLVISGKNDPLIRWRGGRDTAARLPVARFVVYPANGQAVPRELYPHVVEEIRRLTKHKR